MVFLDVFNISRLIFCIVLILVRNWVLAQSPYDYNTPLGE